MSESDSLGKYPIIPPGEIRCVWMDAGLVSYQLCERKLECDECPLDIALRQPFNDHQGVHSMRAALARDRGTPGVHGGMLYGRKHVWVRAGAEHSVRIGIEPGLASVLISPKAIVLPAVGEHVVRNKVCAWIVIEGGTLPIVSPISGTVCLTNTYLAENPHAVCMSPLGQGWLFELTVERAVESDSDLLPVAEAAHFFAEDERRFQGLLSAELARGGEVVGQTLADGGQVLSNLPEILGPTKYFRLVRNIYT
jgi:glycine cleavage system H lipoate-binding protein